MAQRCTVLVLAALLCQAAAEFEAQTCSVKTQATIQPGAEVMLGGILAVQGSGATGHGCGVHKGTMQWYEALRFALGVVNKKDEQLNGQHLDDYYVPGIRLGMHVVDTCGNEDQGVAAVSSIFPSLNADARSCSQLQSNVTLGIVESTGSGTARRVSVFGGQFNVPVVSLASTAPELTTSRMYPNFLRTIPHDNELMTVMGQVLLQLKWHFVVVIYEDSHYGREAYSAVRPVLVEAGVCLSAAFTVVRESMSADSVQSLLAEVVATDAVGTIYLGGMTVIHALLEQGARVSGAGRLQWMVTDCLPQDSTFRYTYPSGVLALVPASRHIGEFEDHWVKLDEENPSLENPWYRQWYMERHHCDLPGVSVFSRPCSALYPNMTAQQIEDSKRQSFMQDLYVEPAVHAIFAYAHALRDAQLALCPHARGLCPQLAALSREDFLHNYLRKVDFTYAAQERVPSLASDRYAPYEEAKRLRFDSRGDIVNPAFFVWNYNNLPTGEEDSASFKFRKVGHFVEGRLSLNMDNIRMYAEDRVTPLLPLPASPCPSGGCSPCVGVPEEVKYYFQDGDIVINGVFSLHRNGPAKFTCRDLLSNRHPLYLEAMIYAVRKVNSDASILRDVALGGLGIDDCMDSDLSTKFTEEVENGLYTVRDRSGSSLDPRKVEAYIGAYSSPLTIPFAGMMDMFMRPMVGYHATSAILDRYKYYLKTVPSVEDEFRAILMIMTKRNWMHTQVLFSADAYSEDDIALFRRVAAKAGVCVVADHMFDSNNTDAMDLLAMHDTVKPVVLLLSPENHRELLDVLNGTSNPNQFQFIATSTFGRDGYVTQGYEAQAEGHMFIDLTYSNLTQFYDDLSTRRVDTYQDNPWFKEWFESAFNCKVGGLPSPCSTNVGITSAPGFQKDLRVVHVINAVYAIARGLDSVLTRYCGPGYRGVCAQFTSAIRANKGVDMVEEILKVSFPIEDSRPTQVFSFSNRGGAYIYNVFHVHAGQFTHVGTVTPSTHSMSQLTGEPDSVSTCPRPCTECLYMFAYQNYWYLDGDLIIPAVFDVHYKGSSMYDCGALRVNNGVQYTEAFKFALDFVNSARSGVNLRNVTVGGLAFDGCSSSDRALAIVNGVMGGSFPIMDRQGERVGVSKLVSWLTYDSESTMGAGDMLKMMGMPLVSPGATAPQLLDKTRYSTFFRTIPSDSVVARAMATFIQDRGWKFVITLNDPDDGSRKTRDLFREYLKNMGICVILSLEFETDGSAGVILNSLQASTTQVVAVFADPHHHVGDLLRRKKDSHPANDLVFIASRYWDLPHMGLDLSLPQLVTNSLSFRLRDPTVSEFVNYLNGLTLADSDNPWLMEYYQWR